VSFGGIPATMALYFRGELVPTRGTFEGANMTTRTRFVSIVTAALVIIWSSYVSAGILTINFPADLADPCTLICTHNTTADGFRISPQFHYDTFVVHFPIGLPGIGWDNNSSLNPDYLGSSVPIPPVFPFFTGLYIDHDGLPFGLFSLESLGAPFIAESSKGALVTIPSASQQPPLHFDFVGPEWRDIQWVTFFTDAPGVPIAGFNQLVTSVPGPPTLGLLGLCVLILGWRSRLISTTRRMRNC
jgi:hypothetical protein